jgi:cell division septation protein DedD
MKDRLMWTAALTAVAALVLSGVALFRSEDYDDSDQPCLRMTPSARF